jgi:hypothetical protein
MRVAANRTIEFYIINLPPRHSGEGRNPACHKSSRSGQSVFGVLSHCVGMLSVVWIPAFAGMTAAVKVSVMNYIKLNKMELGNKSGRECQFHIRFSG